MSQSDGNMDPRQEHEFHRANIQDGAQGQGSNAPETLKYISEPEDIDAPIPSLEWVNSRSTSTANFTDEDVRSKEWILEIHQTIGKMDTPPEYGIKGHLRAFVLGDVDEWKMPLSPDERLETEGYVEIGKEAFTQSKDGWGVETSTRDTKESIVRGEENNASGGILGKIRRD